MKNIYFLLAASLLMASCGPASVVHSDSYQPAPATGEDVSYQSFYDQLSPYGNWVNYPGYGYAWMPNAGPDFQPYATNGNWIYSDAGWTWASDYSWGWAPFHYGRWFYENRYGWMWVPGNEWAPAWVSWRGGGDYYGWAPLGPNVSVDIALSDYNPPANYWNFVPRQYMGNPNWHNYYVGGGRNVTIINNTTIINNYSGSNRNRYAYAPGPDPNEVRRYSGNNFTTVQLRQSSTPGARMNGSQYVIYQPRVSSLPVARGNATGRPATPAPASYEPFNNVRPSTQNPVYNQQANNQPLNNPRPAARNPNAARQNVEPAQQANPNLNYRRLNQYNRNPTYTSPAQTSSTPQHTQVNPAQTTGRPASNHNPANGHPDQRTSTPENKPEQKPLPQPKTREANKN